VRIRRRITALAVDNCDETAPKPGVSTYRALYRWDARGSASRPYRPRPSGSPPTTRT